MIKPDVVAAVMEILKSDPDVASLTAGRVYSPIPRSVLENLVETHEPTVVVMRAPAITAAYANRHSPVGAEGVEVRCFGRTDEEADQLYRACYMALKFQDRTIVQGAQIESILPSADAITGIDEDAGDWPYVTSTYTVLLIEEPVT